MKDILVVGDAHARPEASNRRFSALANYVEEHRPDTIVFIGDLADMGSLSKYDKGTVLSEGKRYTDDVRAAQEAMGIVEGRLSSLRERSVNLHRKRYQPPVHLTLGNHEARIDRAASQDPALHGFMSISDLRVPDRWKVHPFLKPCVVDDIVFQHYFTSGVMGRPIGGDNHAATLVKKNHKSSVCGHSHLRSFWEDKNAVGGKVFGLVVGCFDEDLGTYQYTKEQDRWWSGLVHLRDVKHGMAEPEFININRVLTSYL